ncbi:thioredoxin [Desulfovirgula thermocuniculi]|mgnify:CR=1 FL=1|uniref:thioredoxin n=1 Tax=Desulfovirgula thermocuniculi TaxID=348842 RepID=UPI0003FD29F3|nr:thioredoxin [Desulfovirgula thermocuniculi]
MALELSASNFEEEVLKSAQPVLVDFWAPWCGPCRSMSPIIEELSGEFAGRAKVVKVNVDENRDLAARFGVMSIPTLVFFKDGRVVDQIVGFTPKGVLAKKLESLL